MDKDTVKVIGVFVGVFAISFAVKYAIRRKIVSYYARRLGMSYKDADNLWKAYVKNPNRETFNDLFYPDKAYS